MHRLSVIFMQRLAAVVLGLLVAGACASGGSGASVSGSTVTAADLENVPFTNAYEVLASHNSVDIRGGTLYLRGRGAGGINEPEPALLVLDGTRMGGESAAVLQGIEVDTIDRIEILRPAEATNRFGTQGGGGAVVIRTRRG